MQTLVHSAIKSSQNRRLTLLRLQISEQMTRLVGLLKRDEGDDSARDVLDVRQFGEEEITVDDTTTKEAEGDEDLDIEVL